VGRGTVLQKWEGMVPFQAASAGRVRIANSPGRSDATCRFRSSASDNPASCDFTGGHDSPGGSLVSRLCSGNRRFFLGRHSALTAGHWPVEGLDTGRRFNCGEWRFGHWREVQASADAQGSRNSGPGVAGRYCPGRSGRAVRRCCRPRPGTTPWSENVCGRRRGRIRYNTRPMPCSP